MCDWKREEVLSFFNGHAVVAECKDVVVGRAQVLLLEPSGQYPRLL